MDFFKFFQENYFLGAPLAGITNYPFRKIVRKFHNGLLFTEMVSVEGLKRGNRKSLKLIDIMPDEELTGVQLFGGNADSFKEAVLFINEYFSPFCIDINMGCPVKKVLKSKAGAFLLTDLKNAAKIIRATVKSSKTYVSVKTRLGWDNNNFVYRELLKICENEGVSFLTVHGRTKNQMYSGDVRYDLLSEIKSLSKIPVVGNGDVTNVEMFCKIKDTGVDGVMIGRGMMKSPWIFKALSQYSDPVGYLSGGEIVALLNDLLSAYKSATHSCFRVEAFKKFVVWFSKEYRNSSQFRSTVYSIPSEEKLVEEYKHFYLNEEKVGNTN
jgi:nifR3 family TIM-barrel protein